MLPEQNNINETQTFNPSYTYLLENNRIKGMIDNIDAIKQSIYLILSIERYESLIYNWFYGVEFDTLIGKNVDFVRSEIQRRTKEALIEDDRIKEVSNFTISFDKDLATVEFTVTTFMGNFDYLWEVRI